MISHSPSKAKGPVGQPLAFWRQIESSQIQARMKCIISLFLFPLIPRSVLAVWEWMEGSQLNVYDSERV